MKRFLTKGLSLFVVMLFVCQSFVSVTFAAEQNDPSTCVEGEAGHFLAWSWLHPDEKASHNIFTGFYLTNGSSRPDNPETSLGNLKKTPAVDVAKKMKTFMEEKPAGGRVVMPLMSMEIMDPFGDGTNHGDNWFWWDAGVEKSIGLMKEVIYHYKRMGGPDIDAFIFDYEVDCSKWNLDWDKYRGSRQISDEEQEARYQAIIDDPRYQTTVRPMLEQIGFEFYEGSDHNELYYYWEQSASPENFAKGLLFAQLHRITEMNKFAEYLRSEFPNTVMSNFEDFFAIYNPNHPIEDGASDSTRNSKFKDWPIDEIIAREGTFARLFNDTSMTHISPVFYSNLSKDSTGRKGVYPFETFKQTPFNALYKIVLEMTGSVKFGKAAGIGVQPWVGVYSNDYNRNYSCIMCTEQYKELVLHFALLGADPLLYFNASADNSPWFEDDLVFSRLLDEMDIMAGFDDKEPIIPDEFPAADNRYVLNGMNAGGRTVWRISPDLYCPDESQSGGNVTLKSFLVDSETPTFRIANQYIKFPENSYIYTPETEASQGGYWVVSPLGTKPEEWRDSNLSEAKQSEYTFVSGFHAQELKEKYDAAQGNISSSAVADENTYIPTKSYRDELAGKVTFPDIVGHWCESEMRAFADKGILKGENGLMVPDRQVTKAEFLAMLERGLGIDAVSCKGEFADVASDAWYADIMQTAVESGYIIPDESGNVYPEQPLSRQEMAEIVCRALPELEAGEIKIDFTDYDDIEDDAKAAVDKLVSLELLKGYPDGGFKPSNISTRAETVIVLTGLFAKHK